MSEVLTLNEIMLQASDNFLFLAGWFHAKEQFDSSKRYLDAAQEYREFVRTSGDPR